MQGQDPDNPKFGMGTLRDLFEPGFTRPNLDHRELGDKAGDEIHESLSNTI